MTGCETTGIQMTFKDTPPVTFTASPTKQWAGTVSTVLKSKRGNSIFKIKYSREHNNRLKIKDFCWHNMKNIDHDLPATPTLNTFK